MSEIHCVAAFCSQNAWSVSISSSDKDARFAQRGSVGIFNPRMVLLVVLIALKTTSSSISIEGSFSICFARLRTSFFATQLLLFAVPYCFCFFNAHSWHLFCTVQPFAKLFYT